MNQEKVCARRLSALEDEEFLAIGDEVGKFLNPRFEADRAEGKALSLPDLVSRKRGGGIRLREVKFKLERGLVEKALRQLAAGAAYVTGELDRVEIVVLLGARRLKDHERAFLGGRTGDGDAQRLVIDGEPARVAGLPVSVLIL